jgi:hypothetical protein
LQVVQGNQHKDEKYATNRQHRKFTYSARPQKAGTGDSACPNPAADQTIGTICAKK